MAVIAITSFFVVAYDTLGRPDTFGPGLTAPEKSHINSLSENRLQIPAWLIAQLLDASDRLQVFFETCDDRPEAIGLNNLLADPDRYRSELVVIRGTVAEVSEVSQELELTGDDRCWSIILLDLNYQHPIQLFTTQRSEKFQKYQQIDIIGYYLTNRIEISQDDNIAQDLVVPVLVGAMIPVQRTGDFLAIATNWGPLQLLFIVLGLFIIYIIIRVRLSGRRGRFMFNKNQSS